MVVAVWLLLYWHGRYHYKVAVWTELRSGTKSSFFHSSQIPSVLREAYNLANAACPIGREATSEIT